MFQHTSVIGISMISRQNRRIFVAVVYSLLFCVTVWISSMDPVNHGSIIWMYWVVILVSQWIFGRLVRPMFPLKRDKPKITVSPYTPAERPIEDERETALRSEAYVESYRVILVYAVILLLLLPLFIYKAADLTSGWWVYRTMVLQFFVMLLFGLVLTLPQAIVLWRLDDLFSPGEVQ